VDNPLPVPLSARSDKNAREMLRAWAAHGGLHCSLNVDGWGDEERTVWGIILTDLVRHVADALSEAKGWDQAETVQGIWRVFNAELDKPAADPSGKFHTHR
jgi:hypothetical protein